MTPRKVRLPKQQPNSQPRYHPRQPPKKDDRLIVAVIIVVGVTLSILPTILFFVSFPTPESDSPLNPPTIEWGRVKVLSPTSVTIQFGNMSRHPIPGFLEFDLVRNDSETGLYRFPGRTNGQLVLYSGVNVGTLKYTDYHVDYDEVHPGDEILMTGLLPSSDYTIIMVWIQTGDLLDIEDFSTPAG